MSRTFNLQNPTLRELDMFFDSLIGKPSFFDRAPRTRTAWDYSGYPPCDITQTDECDYEISLAVAGLQKDDIDINFKRGSLVVSSKPTKDEEDVGEVEGTFKPRKLFTGIAKRAFKKTFALGDFVEVIDAEMVDGILTIKLRDNVPEQNKPRTIEIK